MPLDPSTGVFFELHGQGRPLMIGLPLMASFASIFGDELKPVLDGYLDRLTDRYRVLLIDYPGIGGSRDIAAEQLSADRVCADLLGVASSAGFDRFAYWGYSWSGAVGVELARRTDRLDALVIGGWPPVGAPTRALLEATKRKQAEPEPSSMKVLRSKDQYRQWQFFYESVLAAPPVEPATRPRCPAMLLFGAEGDLVEAGIAVPIASTIRAHRAELRASGWRVHEVPGRGHGVCMQPDIVVPPVRAFLDDMLA